MNKTMKKCISVGSLVIAGLIAAPESSEAAILAVGDTLSITGAVDYMGGTTITIPGFGDVGSEFNFFDVGGSAAPAGTYGNFGIQYPSTTGGFTDFETAGNGTLFAGFEILSFDIFDGTIVQATDNTAQATGPGGAANFLADPSLNPFGVTIPTLQLVGVDFLRLENGSTSLTPDLRVTLDEITFFNTSPTAVGGAQTTVVGNVTFYSENVAFGRGGLNATLLSDINSGEPTGLSSFSADFTVTELVTTTPEPSAIGGLIVFGFLGSMTALKKRKERVLN